MKRVRSHKTFNFGERLSIGLGTLLFGVQGFPVMKDSSITTVTKANVKNPENHWENVTSTARVPMHP